MTLGNRQRDILCIALQHQGESSGGRVAITQLAEGAFVDVTHGLNLAGPEFDAAARKAVLFRTRVAVKSLVAHGLLEPAGEMVSYSGGDDCGNPGHYCRKGYTRACKAYRLTAAGRAIAEPMMAEQAAQLPEGAAVRGF